MKPLVIKTDGNEVTLHCTHADKWPPGHARLDEPFDSQRERGFISEAKYQRLQVWERNCGLMEMSEEKCPGCKLVLVEQEGGKLVAPTTGGSHKPFFARAKGGAANR